MFRYVSLCFVMFRYVSLCFVMFRYVSLCFLAILRMNHFLIHLTQTTITLFNIQLLLSLLIMNNKILLTMIIRKYYYAQSCEQVQPNMSSSYLCVSTQLISWRMGGVAIIPFLCSSLPRYGVFLSFWPFLYPDLPLGTSLCSTEFT